MNQENIRVAIGFATATDHFVEGTGYTVHSKLYSVLAFPTPPVTAVELGASNLAFTASLVELVNGGKLATARKNACRLTLVDQLKKLAYYVQIQCGNDLALLLSSGFDSVSTNRARTQLPQPAIIRIENGMSGQTVLAAEANPNVRSWQAEYALIAEDGSYGSWIAAAPGTDSRHILAENLIPGRMYAFRLRSIGGATGCSDWSNTVTHRAA